ncbi:MAG TPA: DUF3089 domain-containing protein, partial [Brevundimonas sp.]|nr:DUF3089 domain-containing protein [Brevundimonas sp.]
MSRPGLTLRQCVGFLGIGFVTLVLIALVVFRGDIIKAGLDPKVPFQTYTPPTAPDYGAPAAWALLEARA